MRSAASRQAGLKIAQAQAERAFEEARRAQQARGELLSSVRHELRTPMNAVLGFSQLVRLGEVTPEQKESVNKIVTAGKRLLRLIDRVLDPTTAVLRRDLRDREALASLESSVNGSTTFQPLNKRWAA